METNSLSDKSSTIDGAGDNTVSTPGLSTTVSKAVSLCGGGLLASFFLPWLTAFGTTSGFGLAKIGGKASWLWSIPLFCAATICVGIAKRSPKIPARLTGALPFCALAYWSSQIGGELFRVLGVGAWLSLIFGLALVILSCRLK